MSPPPQSVHHSEGARLRQLANDAAAMIFFSRHAGKEMAKDRIDKQDVMRVLKRGAVVRVEINRGVDTHNVRGRDSDEREIEVVVVISEEMSRIKVVTAWERIQR